ncbi:MAG TPA: hypothetical protein VFG19_06010, partial [Geobacteraceae bacterium]|nr:hypothetical protein [Geobacteraceae bacterium]
MSVDTSSIVVRPEQHEMVLIQNHIEETYSLDKIPAPTSSLVLDGKQEILHEMNLDTVLDNLELVGGLLYVAYNGVAGAKGGQLQAKCSGLQKSLADLCIDCVLTMQTFQSETADVLGYLVDTFDWLLQGEEKLAIKQLGRCEQCADNMATASEKLAARFDAYSKDAEQVLEDTQVEQGAQYEKKQEMERKLREIEADKKKTESLQKEIAASAQQMQELYNEAKAREETESERAFALGIVSAITSAIGAGVAAFAASQNPLSKTGIPNVENQENEKALKEAKKKQKEADDADDEAAEAEKKAKEKEKEAEEAEEEATKAGQEAEEKKKAAEEKPED